MKGLLLHEPRGALSLSDVADPICDPDGVIVELAACGVCRSDHHAWVGADPDVTFPHIMGHEFCGRVIETGSAVSGFAKGDRVTAPFILACGSCTQCHGGEPTTCDHQDVIGFTIPGAFAENIAIPNATANLVKIPETVADDVAAGMGCRVTTAWRALIDRGGLKSGEWLAIFGCGGVGLAAILIAKSMGAKVVAVDTSADARAAALRFGADVALDAPDAADHIRDITKGGADVAIDALGITATFHAALYSLRKLGRHVQIGMPVGQHATPTIPLLDLVYARQLSLHGTRGMSASGFPTLFDALADGQLELGPLITRRIALSETQSVLEDMDCVQKPGVTVITDFTR